jgi:hypothetical protein
VSSLPYAGLPFLSRKIAAASVRSSGLGATSIAVIVVAIVLLEPIALHGSGGLLLIKIRKQKKQSKLPTFFDRVQLLSTRGFEV